MAAFVYPGLAGLMLLAQVGGVSMQGTRASASDIDGRAFFMTGADPVADEWQSAIGHVSLSAEDRVQLPGATWGDQGTLHAEIRYGGDTWTLDLTQPGFPADASGRASPVRGWVRFPISGGVLTDANLQGYTGLGLLRGPLVHAAAAIWGEGTVRLNGQLVTDHALVEADALSAGDHADDQSFRTLTTARDGDAEIVIFATNLPVDRVPRGFVLVGFDDVRISVGGQVVASQITIPSSGTQGPAEVAGSTGPVYAPSPILGVGGSGGAGTATNPQTVTPPGAIGGTGFSSSGIPASPPVANNGATTTALPATPAPLTSTPATPLIPMPSPANATPATALPATPPVTAPAGTGTTGTVTTPATGTATPGTTTGVGTTSTGAAGTATTGTGTAAGTTGTTATGTATPALPAIPGTPSMAPAGGR